MNDNINLELQRYIENNIFPIYLKNDEGHGIEHIKYVIKRSIGFANKVDEIDYNMVYTIASYHDIGHHIDKDNHEKISADILLNDKNLKQFFKDEQIQIMAEAVEDHRASLEYEPRSIYGKIVSSADRNTIVDLPLRRTYTYRLKHSPSSSLQDVIEDSRQHVLGKFGIDGYAREKMYFEDLEYEQFLKDVTALAQNKEAFIKRYLEVNKILDWRNQMREIEKGRLYRHFKGNLYQVLDIVNDCESNNNEELDKVVIYQALYGDYLTWARSYSMFNSEVDHEKYPNVNQTYRFEEYQREHEKEGLRAFLALKFYDGDTSKKLVDNLTEALSKINIHTFVAVRDIEQYGEAKDLDMDNFMPKYAFPEMQASDLFIVEFSEKGVGLGMGAAFCYANNIPVYIIAKTGSDISTTINSVAEKVIFYDTMDDITRQFKELIEDNQLKTNPKTLKLTK